PQLAWRVLFGAARRRHAALAAQPFAEGDAGEVAAKIVAPVVIDADDVARLPALVEHEQGAAMGTAILEGVQRAMLVAGDHDRHRTEIGAAVGVGAGQLGLEAEEIPGRPLKDPLLLPAINVAVGVEPIRDAGEALGGPASRIGGYIHRSI